MFLIWMKLPSLSRMARSEFTSARFFHSLKWPMPMSFLKVAMYAASWFWTAVRGLALLPPHLRRWFRPDCLLTGYLRDLYRFSFRFALFVLFALAATGVVPG